MTTEAIRTALEALTRAVSVLERQACACLDKPTDFALAQAHWMTIGAAERIVQEAIATLTAEMERPAPCQGELPDDSDAALKDLPPLRRVIEDMRRWNTHWPDLRPDFYKLDEWIRLLRATPPAERPAPEPVAPIRYRMLQRGEQMHQDDEGLHDDSVTWLRIGWPFAHCKYDPGFFNPVRRKVDIPAAPQAKDQT